MACGGSVQDDELVCAGGYFFGESLENRDLFRARRAEILFEQGDTRGVERGGGLIDDLLGVLADFFVGIDAGDGEAGHRVADGGGDVGGRVRGAEMDFVAAAGKFDGNRGSNCRLADASLPHGQDDAVACGFEFIDEMGQRWGGAENTAEIGDADGGEIERRVFAAGEFFQIFGDVGEGALGAGFERVGNGVTARGGGVEDGVEGEDDVGDAGGGEFGAGSFGFVERGRFGAGDEDYCRFLGVLKVLHTGCVDGLLRLESGEGAKAGGAGGVGGDEVRPGGGEAEQAEGMAGGRGVENDVVVVFGGDGVGQEFGEFVERGDFDGAGAGELFFHALDGGGGKELAIGTDYPFAVVVGGGGGIDVERG